MGNTFRVVGRGRAGGAVERALVRADWTSLPAIGRGGDVASAGHGADLVLIATPDDVIAEVALAIEPSAGVVVAHLSGSLGLDVLAPHPRRA